MLRRIIFITFAVPILLAPACSGKKEQQARRGSDLGFAVEIGLDQGVLDSVVSMASGTITQLTGIDENFEKVKAPGLVFQVEAKDTEDTLVRLRNKLSGSGFAAYIVERNFGYSPDLIGVVKGTDPYEMMRLMGTNGINYDITNADVINKIRQWEGRYTFDIISISFDSIEAVFLVVPVDIHSFARDVYEFCPDVVEQGTGSVEALAAEMGRSGRLFLWWD
jgi:hypothetical protein